MEGGAGEGEREREGEEDKLYVFLSIFKFEERKGYFIVLLLLLLLLFLFSLFFFYFFNIPSILGWKELMSAFTQEFSKKKDKVLLLVVSHTDNDNMKVVPLFSFLFFLFYFLTFS